MKKLLILPVFALCASFATVGYSETAETSLEKLVSELADKPEQHDKVGQYYAEKAAKAREEAAEHKRMASMPIGHSKDGLRQLNWENHCKKLSTSLEEVAKEYDELARLHSESAK